MKSFGQQVIVTFNRFATDTDEEIALVAEHCKEKGVGFAMNNVFSEGGEGGTELARLVVDTIENHPSAPLQYTYDLNDPIRTKVQKVAQKIYGASSIVYTTLADKKIASDRKLGYFPLSDLYRQDSIFILFRSESLWGRQGFRTKSTRCNHQ